MTILTLAIDPVAVEVHVSDSALRVVLEDGRDLSVPIEWFPRLRGAGQAARENWRFIGRGEGIHWPDLDEDISVEGLLAGHAAAPACKKRLADAGTSPDHGAPGVGFLRTRLGVLSTASPPSSGPTATGRGGPAPALRQELAPIWW